MIICHRHRFIFIKTRKTAGTSVEIALAALCGPEDVLSPISPEDEAIRTRRGHRPAQNFMVPWSRYGALDWARLLARGHRPRFYNHAPASYIMQYVPARTWHTYYKFCFERNPWDKVVSSFFWERKRAPGLQLSEFVLSGAANKVADFDMYAIRGELVVDDVLPYENLAGGLQQVFARVGATESPRTFPMRRGASARTGGLIRSCSERRSGRRWGGCSLGRSSTSAIAGRESLHKFVLDSRSAAKAN